MTDSYPREEPVAKTLNININCKYEKLGCEFKAPLNNLEELKTHYREDMYKHLKMCYEEYAMLEEKFKQLRAIITSCTQRQNEEVKTVE